MFKETFGIFQKLVLKDVIAGLDGLDARWTLLALSLDGKSCM